MAPKGSSGPGRAQRKGTSAGRTTTRPASRVGRYTAPEESGKYTPPIPRAVKRSAPWFGPLVLLTLVIGVLLILLNYLTVLPGSASTWYLVSGIVIIAVAFGMATRYR